MNVCERYESYSKRVLLDGVERNVVAVDIAGQQYVVQPGLARLLRLEDEWHEDVREPHAVITALEGNPSLGIDIFTFWERPPSTVPTQPFHTEVEAVAAIPICTYDDWLKKQITAKTRNMIKKSVKSGIEIRETEFDNEFISGMVRIFNESAVRQGRPFWHFGKDAETLRKQFSRFLFRERIFGAYLKDELVGFMFLAFGHSFANLSQIISAIRHRDKAPNNALIAKAVQVCADESIDYLLYANWPPPGGLVDFKRANGFEKLDVPRYFVPITWKGRVALRAGIHRDWKEALPPALRVRLKNVKANLAQIGR